MVVGVGVGALGFLGRGTYAGGVRVAESVQLETIWLVDLVGSTRLATSVGPVRADELREEYFALLREAIEPSGGREFKNTGDGLMVAFSSASAAVKCAVLTQQLFERRYRGAEQRLRVRIGLGTGESTGQGRGLLRDAVDRGGPVVRRGAGGRDPRLAGDEVGWRAGRRGAV